MEPKLSSHIFYLCLLCCCSYQAVLAEEYNNVYNDGEDVVLWLNTVWPSHNRGESYPYFSLPFCRGSAAKEPHHSNTLIEALQGLDLQYSGYDMQFKTDVPRTVMCAVQLKEDHIKAFSKAVRNDYRYDLYLDGLSIVGQVGKRDEQTDKIYVYTHQKFDIGYNRDRIVNITLTSLMPQELQLEELLKFSFEVNWHRSDMEFRNRFDRYRDDKFLQDNEDVFSTYGSLMLLILLIGVVSAILVRISSKYFARLNLW